jgi:hypothetical protein
MPVEITAKLLELSGTQAELAGKQLETRKISYLGLAKWL